VELEALYDRYYLSTRKKVEFFGEIRSRSQSELETQSLSDIPTEKLFSDYAHFYREAERALPQLAFDGDEEIKAAKTDRLAGDALHAEGRDL
jgi:hypothetical protein